MRPSATNRCDVATGCPLPFALTASPPVPCLRRQRAATALSLLNESLGKEKKPPAKESFETKIELLEALGWAHWAAAIRAQLAVKFPPAFPLVFSRLD